MEIYTHAHTAPCTNKQNNHYGYVHNAVTGVPVAGVTVTFSHAALSVVTPG